MVTPELSAYIKSQLANNKTKEQIQVELMQGGGWKISDIEEAFVALSTPSVQKPKTRSSKFFNVAFVLILVVVGGAYAASKFNIRSPQEFIERIVGGKEEQLPIVQQQSSSSSSTVTVNTDVSGIEKNIIAGLIMVRMGKKTLLYEKGSSVSVCTYGDFVTSKAKLIQELMVDGFSIAESEYRCVDTGPIFSVSLPLPRGGYYCIDMISAGVVDVPPAGTLCGAKSTTYTVQPSSDIDELFALEAQATTSEGLAQSKQTRIQDMKERDTRNYLTIRAIASMDIYANSYSAVCTEILNQVPSAACFATANNWAVSFPLVSQAGYGCIDKTEVERKIASPVTSTLCPTY